MNRILTVPFLRGTLRISRTPAGDVHKVCVNDLCGAMRRSILLKNGTVLRRCPSLTYLDAEHPEELYADFTEAVELVKWMSSGAKLLRMRGREVLENLQHLRMAQDTTATDVSEGSAPRIIELEYVGNRFSVRLEDGRYMVNATEMARPFDKRPAVWLKLTETARLREALVEDGISADTEQQVITTRGPHGATWLEIHLWTQFAQWLSPAFAAWCSKKLLHLLRDGHTELQEVPQPVSSVSDPTEEFCSEDLLLPAP